jgi:hypothetical protein
MFSRLKEESGNDSYLFMAIRIWKCNGILIYCTNPKLSSSDSKSQEIVVSSTIGGGTNFVRRKAFIFVGCGGVDIPINKSLTGTLKSEYKQPPKYGKS